MLGGSTDYRRWCDQSRVFKKLATLMREAGLSTFAGIRQHLIDNDLVPKPVYPFTRGMWSVQTPDPISPERCTACVIQTMMELYGR